MAKRSVITNKGMELLAASSEATGQYWWIGHYGLAYVPNVWKESPVDVNTDDQCGRVNSALDEEGSTIDITDADLVSSSMTQLTENGDMIYNIFQGDLVGTGYRHCVSDGSVGGDLFGLTMYNTNIKKHYRYVLNEYGNNTLVTWIDYPDATDTTGESGLMKGKYAYLGTDGFSFSDIAIPAPLYYLGNSGNSDTSDFFPGFENEVTNGASIYPYITVEVKAGREINVPMVTVDYREYLDSQGKGGKVEGGGLYEYPYDDLNSDDPTRLHESGVGDEKFDGLDVPSSVDTGFDTTSWYAADLTFIARDIDPADVDSTICKEFWKLLSISNYNKYHAPVGSTGHVLSSDLSNRNMSKTTKFFPISSYKVINTEAGVTSSGENVEVASAISIKIDLDLAPRVKAEGVECEDTCDFNETANLSFFDKYDLRDKGIEQTTQDYYASSEGNILDQFEKNIFNTAHTSFKFNRIGLYAVPLRKCPFLKDESDPTGKNVIIQFDINPDIEPILFAVIDWDNTVTLDDTGNGIHQFNAEFNLNLSSGNLDADALVRDSVIYYNLYEDDALTWYQNQLVANASTQNAIMEIGLEVQNIKTRQGGGGCPPPDLSKKYASLNHSHSRISSAEDGIIHGTIRGISTVIEYTDITIVKDAFISPVDATEKYTLHENSTVFGYGNKVHASKNSTISNGLNSTIYDSFRSGIVAGQENIIGGACSQSFIGSGYANRLASAESSFVGSGNTNRIIPSSDGYLPKNSGIVAGLQNDMIPAYESIIGAGTSNLMESNATGDIPTNSGILAGASNRITAGYRSFIGTGYSNVIIDRETNEWGDNAILSGNSNSITTSRQSIILGGSSSAIESEVISSSILGGDGHTISTTVENGTIVGGTGNKVSGNNAVAMGDSAIASNTGEVVLANGNFSAAGDAQHSRIVLTGTTTGTVNRNLVLGDGGFYDLDKIFNGKYGTFSGVMKLSGQAQGNIYDVDWIIDAGVTQVITSGDGIFSTIGDYLLIEGSTKGYNGLHKITGNFGSNTELDLTLPGYPGDDGSGITATILTSSCLAVRQFSGYYDGISGDENSHIVTSSLGDPIFNGVFDAMNNYTDPLFFGDMGVSGKDLFARAESTLGTVTHASPPNIPVQWVAEIDMIMIARSS